MPVVFKEAICVLASEWYDNMRSKYGFSDGDAVPLGAEVYRQALIAVFNAALAEYGVEAYPYDRPGFHNWCLICFRRTDSDEPDFSFEPDEVYEVLRMMDATNLLEALVQVDVHLLPPEEMEDAISSSCEEVLAEQAM